MTSSTVAMTGEASFTAHTTNDSRDRVKTADAVGPAGSTSSNASYDAADLPFTFNWSALGASGSVTNTYAKTNEWLSTTAGGTTWTFTTWADERANRNSVGRGGGF